MIQPYQYPRGVAAYAARWGGTGRTTGIGFLHRLSLQRAPSNPPALGLGFDAWGHSRETREVAGAASEKGQLRALTVGRQKTRLRGSRHTNPRYPTRPKDISVRQGGLRDEHR